MIMEVKDIDTYCKRGISPNASNYLTAPFDGVCLQKFFYQLQASLRRFSQWEEIVYTLIYIAISVSAVIGNGLVILAVVRKKAMRTNRNVLILNLALSNLILALINIPFLWLPSIDFEFPYSRFFCKFANVLPGSNIYCSTLTISVMAIDRYVYSVKFLKIYYSVKKLKMTSNRKQCFHAVLMSVFIWIASFILSLPLLLYYETSMLYVMREIRVMDQNGQEVIRSYGWRQCRLLSAGRLPDITQYVQLGMSVLQVAFLYIVPLVVLSFFNVKLTRFLKTNTPSLCSPSMPSNRTSGVERNTTTKRTSRTTSLLMAMAGSYAALWLPFTLITFLIDFELVNNQEYVNLVERIDQTCKMISMFSICINPILYGYLNTNFRHEFSDIYHRYIKCETKSQNTGRFQHDVSSIAHHRQDSVYNDDATLLNTGRQSIVRDGSSSPRGFRSSIRVCTTESKMIGDRIVLDDDIEKDSFV
ncbi:hypothetical protein CAEBREN_09467 [Caenorhabditis brenneri]|uniref:G-protein coupled receptors family 1 profile domain-containing protein n=1 Tax=Caenorhabditis brenneri TaxID=135651 RepID=G0N4Y1_CAEBE|nr:hypothetical protein CAEBREN_09467 [Caenorhabditis brenneri]